MSDTIDPKAKRCTTMLAVMPTPRRCALSANHPGDCDFDAPDGRY